ncbi:MAG: PGPGW domain-containing protein [Actinomycetota bacterium]
MSGGGQFRNVVRFIGRSSKRVGVSIAGFALLAAGIAMLVFPGPGLLVVVLGFAVLATEYVWARRALDFAKDKAKKARRRAGGLFRRRKPTE